jgi:Type VI secretion system effector, Hcp
MGRAREYETSRRRGSRSARSSRPVDGMVALQQAVGNRTLAALLARQPRTKPKEPAAEERTSHVVLPGIGRIGIESFSWNKEGSVGGGPGKADLREIQITSTAGKHSAALQNAVAHGAHFKQVELVHYGSGGAGIRLKLTDVAVTSYQLLHGTTTGVSEQWSVSFATAEHEYLPRP